ncbi:MAG: MarR family transcriptional regulator [Eubacteriaceae bacterium]|nr:MarR family transcriptional regulator [Eubacteriaceae bacterium]
MIDRFENFAAYIAQANKYILKIKAAGMERFGLKAAHLMCLYFLGKHEEGLTAGELAEYCMEDKAAISKSLSELRHKDFVRTDNENGTKVYRAKYFLSPTGKDAFAEIKDTILHITELVADGLSLEEGAILYRSLEKVVSNLKDYYLEMDKPER